MKRKHYFTLRLSDDEYRKLTELAEKAGVTYSTVIRKLILGEEIKERPDVDFLEFRQAVDHIGVNINQIAHWANANGGITAEQFEEAKKLLSDVRFMIKGLSKTWL